MGAGGSTGKTMTSVSRERRKEKKERRRARRKQHRMNRRKRRRELKEEPPAAALQAAETRGDMVRLRGPEGEEVKLFLCKRSRLEYTVDGTWKKAITGLKVAVSDDEYITVKTSRGLVISEAEWTTALNATLLFTARLADLAAVKHDIWLYVREVEPQPPSEARCEDCGMVIRSAPPFCDITGRIHPPQLWIPQSPAIGYQHPSWTDATRLPAGTPQPALSQAIRRYSMRAPASLSLEDIESSGDTLVHFTTADGEALSLSLSQTSRLELYSSATWVSSILNIELVTDRDKLLRLTSAKGAAYEAQLGEDFKDIIPKIGILCDAACVNHNLWGGAACKIRIWACPACLFRNSDREVCAVCGACRPDLLAQGDGLKTRSSSTRSSFRSTRSSSPASPRRRVVETKKATSVALPPLPGSTHTSPTHPPSGRVSGQYTWGDETTDDSDDDCESESSFTGDEDYDTEDITSDEEGLSPPASPRTRDRKNLKKNCIVCKIAVKNTVLMPCRHLSVCDSCAPELQSCPMCKGLVTHRLEVWA
eukprot:TRINITY_DN24877_c0_g1_i1.p1 TRINITY_DN24877_c0_g1~~TRINITY_DN24877_c0_g1_i1.p1  ORF type:complete len:548 (+),score=54.07 TRINITY_DN24877_c0_g1_i1:38-1645(+)